jgi:hypothetical protein
MDDCCGLIHAKELSPAMQEFASKVMAPIIQKCFAEIESCKSNLNNVSLKGKLLDTLAKI